MKIYLPRKRFASSLNKKNRIHPPLHDWIFFGFLPIVATESVPKIWVSISEGADYMIHCDINNKLTFFPVNHNTRKFFLKYSFDIVIDLFANMQYCIVYNQNME